METSERLNNAAIEMTSRQDFDAAIALFVSALRDDVENPYLWYNLGITQRKAGLLDDSIESYWRTVEISPEWDEAWAGLGGLYFEQGRYIEAHSCLCTALKYNEDSSEAWNNLGAVYLRHLGFTEARDCFERALAANPLSSDALQNLRDVYRELQDWKAAAEIEKLCAWHGIR